MSLRGPVLLSLLTLAALAVVLSTVAPAAAGEAYLVRDIDTTAGEVGPGDGLHIPCPPPTLPCEGLYRGSFPLGLVPLGDEVVFAASDRLHGGELWRSDGTATGTRRITDLCPGECNSVAGVLGRLGSEVYFWASDDESGPPHLWKSDGTEAGTVQVADLCSGRCDLSAESWQRWGQSAWPVPASEDLQEAVFGGRLFFFAAGDGAGLELWATDGTSAGTQRLADACPGPCDWSPRELLSADDGVYARGVLFEPGPNVTSGVPEVWRSRGSAGDTERVFRSPRTPAGAVLEASEAVIFDGTLYVATAGVAGRPAALWAVGAGQPRRIWQADVTPSSLQDLAVAGDRLYFSLVGGSPPPGRLLEGSYRLWSSDGTGGGTRPLSAPLFRLHETVGIGDLLFFTGEEEAGEDREQVYVARGADVARWPAYPGREGAVLFARSVDGSLLLHEWPYSGESLRQRVLSGDGREGLRTLVELPFVSHLSRWAAAGDHLYFAADDGERGVELWAVPRAALETARCSTAGGTLCLGHGRFAARVRFRNQHAGGVEGSATAVPGTPDAGFFHFFRPENLELVVKVLDGTGVNGHHWVFHGGITDLEYDLELTDLDSGETRKYHHPPGDLCGGADTRAFPVTAADAVSIPASRPPPPVPRTVRSAASPACPTTPDTLCLGDGTHVFDVRATYRNQYAGGAVGPGRGEQLSVASGWFWTFDADNPELLVKVLDGRPVNGRWWVFVGGLSTVEMEVEVTFLSHPDRPVWRFVKPPGSTCGVADVTAFATP